MPNELLGMYLEWYVQPASRNGFSMCEKETGQPLVVTSARFGRNSIVRSRVTGRSADL